MTASVPVGRRWIGSTGHGRGRAALLAALMPGLAWGLQPADAQTGSAAVVAVGWWSRNPTQSDPPAGGFAVANAPDGPMAVAALRLRLESPETVTLSVHEAGGNAPLGAAIQICVAKSPWKAGAGGSWSEAPEPDCDAGSVDAERNAEGNWTADISTLVGGGTWEPSIMLVPAADGPAIFDLTFSPPGLTSTGSSAASPPSGMTAEPESQPVQDGPPATEDAGTDGGKVDLDLQTPPVPSAIGDNTGEEAHPPGPPPQPTAENPLVALPTRPSVSGGRSGKAWTQGVRLLTLALVVGAAAAVARRSATTVDLEGRVATVLSSWRSRQSRP